MISANANRSSAEYHTPMDSPHRSPIFLRRERVEALVFPEKGLRQAPMSPVDGRLLPWAGPVRVLDLLKQQAAK